MVVAKRQRLSTTELFGDVHGGGKDNHTNHRLTNVTDYPASAAEWHRKKSSRAHRPQKKPRDPSIAIGVVAQAVSSRSATKGIRIERFMVTSVCDYALKTNLDVRACDAQ